jgi:ankyrin repeat protein
MKLELGIEMSDQSFNERQGSDGDRYPLHGAVLKCDEALTLQLLDQGNDPNVLDNVGMAPLHWAVYGGYYEIVKMLLENGAQPDFPTRSGETALGQAEDDFGLTTIAELLVNSEPLLNG